MKRTTYALFAMMLGLALICSCSTTAKVSVTDGLRLNLLPASAITEPLDVYQLMEGTIPGYGEAVLESYLVADESGIEMYLFAPTGQTIAVVHYDGNKASMESEFIPHGEIAAAYMVFDIQMCYADCKAIEACGLQISETTGESKERVVSYKGEILYKISYAGNTCTLVNMRRAYSYTLETLE